MEIQHARLPALLMLLALGVGLTGSPLAGQEEPNSSGIVVVGAVKDVTLQTPVPQARLQFFRAPPEDSSFTQLARETVAGADGSFRLAGLPVGNYRIQVEALGYQPLDREVRVDGASPMGMDVQLAPAAVELDAIVVVSRRSRSLESQGFYGRREQGLGKTFTRAEIEATGYMRVTDIIRNSRGLTLRRTSPAASPQLFMRGGGSACRPDIILDAVNLGSDLSVDNMVSALDLEAIEVHRSTSIPPQFRQSHCGAVVLWTRDPHMGGATRPTDMRRWAAAGAFALITMVIAR